MADSQGPYIPAETELPELTLKVIILGCVLGVLMTAANAYLGLYVGMTVSASIPAAVLSMLLLRGLKFKDVNILENNAVQTMASAGESLAAGVIFTVPALLVMQIWDEIQLLETFLIALLGGVLGTMFTIALRRVFIVEEALPYPEGVACKEVLVAGGEGGSSLVAIVYALILCMVYGWMAKGFVIIHHSVEKAVSVIGTRVYMGAELSVALVAVGYIVGLRIASYIFLGGVIGYGILVPLYGLIYGWPVDYSTTDSFIYIWNEQIRFAGVGAMVVGGIWTLWSMRKTIAKGFSKALNVKEKGSEDTLRTERDIDMRYVFMVCIIIVFLTFLFYWWAIGSYEGVSTMQALGLAISGALFLALVAFFFSAVAGYIAGVVGSSNSPVSGMTIATLMFTSLLVWVVGWLLGVSSEALMFSTLIIAAIVAVNAAIAGDVMQDLKTGNMVGATPAKQQTAEIIGVIVGAIVIGPVLVLLNRAFRISRTYCLSNPPVSDPTCSKALLAPQAELIGGIITGIFGGTLNYPMVILGALIAVLIIWKKLPVMSVAIGIYLPLYLSVPIVIGGLIHYLIMNITYLRVDGNIREEPSIEAQNTAHEVGSRGIMIGAGLIAGEALMGVIVALFIVMASIPGCTSFFGLTGQSCSDGRWYSFLNLLGPPDQWFGLGELNPLLSLIFFGWFLLVFAYLATRTLPERDGGNGILGLFGDAIITIKESIKALIKSIMPPNR